MRSWLGSHDLGTHGWLRLLVASAIVLVLILTLEANPAAGASRKSCRVRNTDSGQTYTALQAAVDAATRGDRLMVHGTCLGRVVIDRGLVIQGQRARDGRSLLDGDRQGVVLTIRIGVSVKVTDLAIEGGRGHFQKGGPEKPNNWPAGVLNHGNLTLRDVMVRRNQGLGVENRGTLRLNGHSVIGDNWGVPNNFHPGIHNAGTLRLNGTSTIRNNDGLVNDGTLFLHGGSSANDISNRGRMTLQDAGRVTSVGNRGGLTLDDQSRIDHLINFAAVTLHGASRVFSASNVAKRGGLTLDDQSRIDHLSNHATVTLNGSSSISGGSVWNTGTLTLNGSASVSGGHVTRPLVCPVRGSLGCSPALGPFGGGGILNKGALVLNDSSSISGNSVEASDQGSYGGGIYMPYDPSLPEPPSLTMTGSATITGNTADRGGGVYAVAGSVLTGVVCGPGGNVTGNTPDDCYVEP